MDSWIVCRDAEHPFECWLLLWCVPFTSTVGIRRLEWPRVGVDSVAVLSRKSKIDASIAVGQSRLVTRDIWLAEALPPPLSPPLPVCTLQSLYSFSEILTSLKSLIRKGASVSDGAKSCFWFFLQALQDKNKSICKGTEASNPWHGLYFNALSVRCHCGVSLYLSACDGSVCFNGIICTPRLSLMS